MSGPVSTDDAPTEPARPEPEACEIEITESREAEVGGFRVRRALPRRPRRTVGAWCFADHMGPGIVAPGAGLVGPHPHIGLQTVTWLIAGELLHRDSLGSEQLIRPGQLNLMTAGHGVSHAEESTGSSRGPLHGIQLWVAQPSSTRHGAPAFEHHPELPEAAIVAGSRATVLVGAFAGQESPARRDTDHVGVDLDLAPGAHELPLDPSFEHALVVLSGAVAVDGRTVAPGHLGYLGIGRNRLVLDAPADARLLLLGGTPFPEPIVMWWNYVGRDTAELSAAHRDWLDGAPRFGRVASALPRITTGPPPWELLSRSSD